jgi:hypothetical protein
MSKFVLIIPTCIPVAQEMVTQHFIRQGADWWHWSPDVWLLRFNWELTSAQIGEGVKQMLPNVLFVAMRIPDQLTDWSGWGPPTWQEWFNRGW